MLTPSERLGLAGATLSLRLRRALHALPDRTLQRLTDTLREDARRHAVVYEHQGVVEPVRIMLRPLVATADQLSYVHHVCTKLTDALKRIPELYLADADVRRLLRIRDDEAAFLHANWTPLHGRDNPVYGRLDAVCDFESPRWQQSLWFMEPNLSGVGGIHFAPLAESLVTRDVLPALSTLDPELALSLPRDQRDLFVEVLLEHAAAVGRPGRVIALVEPKYEHDGPNEQPVLMRYLVGQLGLTVVHVDPRELRCEGGEVYAGDLCVDVAYRDYETRDLLELERSEGRPLHGMRTLFAQNRVVSSLAGDFDHKSCWELLGDEALAARFFSSDERRLFRRHVLWTRLVRERYTSLPHGEGELVRFARAHREDLVLKPNRGYGGAGVHVGHATSQDAWEALLDEALACADDPERSWVVQQATRLPVVDFPEVDGHGAAHDAPYYAVMGFAATDAGLGVLCRVSQKEVVNVAQRGGLAALLVGAPPRELATARRSRPRGAEAEPALRKLVCELKHLDQTLGLLGWDEETYLPEAARDGRGAQLATLESLRHGLLCSERLGDLMAELSERADTPSDLEAELRVLARLRKAALRLPEELVRSHAGARSECLGAWEAARSAGDYAAWTPSFAQLLALSQERARCLADGGDPFDALLDEHEPGLTRARLEPALYGLARALGELVQSAATRPAPAPGPLAGIGLSTETQRAVCRALLARMSFDFRRGRLDESSHPFTLAAGPDDVRLTVRFEEHDFPRALFATLHEGGHGLYDQGFRAADAHSLLGDAPSMGLHEAFARLWENVVGRSAAFWQGFVPVLRAAFPRELSALTPEAAYGAVNLVRPSLVRIEADEVTYDLHILLRYELELALLSGALSVGDLPGAWDEKCRELFGRAPASAREGCLQDVHWSLGTFGYFPTYTVGNLYAAELAQAYARQQPLASQLARHELAPLADWLRKQIAAAGQRSPAEALVRSVTGQGLSAAAFIAALQDKHG